LAIAAARRIRIAVVAVAERVAAAIAILGIADAAPVGERCEGALLIRTDLADGKAVLTGGTGTAARGPSEPLLA
jgi:hypothetical protein